MKAHLSVGSTLALTVFLSVLLLSLLQTASSDRMASNRALRLNQQLDAVLKEVERNNDPASDILRVQDRRLGSSSPLPLFRARYGERPTAVSMTLVAPNGYSGDIRLLLGVDRDGTVLGTRVLEHRETPGIGDRIEFRRSPWITSLEQRSLKNTSPDTWHTDSPDGAFDAITGATITSEAILSSVKSALSWYEDNRETVFDKSDTVDVVSAPNTDLTER